MHSNKAIEQLNSLLGKDKFIEDLSTFYPGCPDSEIRKNLNEKIDKAINEFIDAAKNNSSKDEYLALLKKEVYRFDQDELDTEDAERVGTIFEQIMDCIGLESSEGILNTWMYGFDPNSG